MKGVKDNLGCEKEYLVVLFVNMVTYREGRRAGASRRATEAYPSGTPQGAERRWARPTALECHHIYE